MYEFSCGVGEEIVIVVAGHAVEVRVVAIEGRQIKLGLTAPRNLRISRAELDELDRPD